MPTIHIDGSLKGTKGLCAIHQSKQLNVHLLLSHFIEALVFASEQHSVQEEDTQSKSPYSDEDEEDDLSGVVCAGQEEGEEVDECKVHGTCNVRDLMQEQRGQRNNVVVRYMCGETMGIYCDQQRLLLELPAQTSQPQSLPYQI
jgi:hypothetical protein